MSKVHDRIVELVLTADAVNHFLTVTKLNYYRTRARLDDALPFAITYSPATAQTTTASSPEISLGELLPPPTIIRFTTTGI